MATVYQEERKPDTITFLKLAKKQEEPKRSDDVNSLDFPPNDVITVPNYENSIYSSDDDSKYFTEDPRSRAYSQGIPSMAINVPPQNIQQYSKGGIIINGPMGNTNNINQPGEAHLFPFNSTVQVSTNRGPGTFMIPSPITVNSRPSQHQNMLSTSPITSPSADKFGSSSAYTNSYNAGETYKPNNSNLNASPSYKRKSLIEVLSLSRRPDSSTQNEKDTSAEPPVSPTNTKSSKIPMRSPKRPLSMHATTVPQAVTRSGSEYSLDPANYKENNINQLVSLSSNPGTANRSSNIRSSLVSNGTDSFSVTSFDHLTQRNTDLNSRRIMPNDHFDTVEETLNENEDEENKRVSLQLKPPTGNMIQEDLDLTDDEQLTNLITSMKLEKLNNSNSNKNNIDYTNRSLRVIDNTYNEFGPNGFLKKNLLAAESSLPMANSSDLDFDIEKELRLAKQRKMESFTDIPTRKTSNGVIQSSILPHDNESPVSSSASMTMDNRNKVKNIMIDGTDYNNNDETLTAPNSISEFAENKTVNIASPNGAHTNNTVKSRVPSKTFADASSVYLHQRYKSDAMESDVDYPKDIDPKKKLTGKNIPAITHRELPTPPIEKKQQPKSPIEELTDVVDKELKSPGRFFSKTSTIDRLIQDQTSSVEELHLDKKHDGGERRKSGSKSRNPSGIDYKHLSSLLKDANVSSEDKEISRFLPEDEKILLNKTIDALSKLTAEMIADPNRYKEGMKRMKKALNILEGFE